MNYTIETTINKPIGQVVKIYNQVELYPEWMPGIVSHSINRGNKRETGTASVYTLKMGGKEYDMNETVIKNEGEEIVASYEANGVVNTQKTVFKEISEGKTLYQVNENFALKGFMKIIGFLMPGTFKSQTKKFVNAFKEYVEQP